MNPHRGRERPILKKRTSKSKTCKERPVFRNLFWNIDALQLRHVLAGVVASLGANLTRNLVEDRWLVHFRLKFAYCVDSTNQA